MSYHSQFYNIRPGEDEAPINEDVDFTQSDIEAVVKQGTKKGKKEKNENIYDIFYNGGSKSRKHLSRKRKGKKSYRKRKYGKSKKSMRFRRSVKSRR